MRTFFKSFLVKIVGYSAGIALIGSAYLYVDSIKNKPLSKDDVKEIVKYEVAPVINTLSDHLESTRTQQADFYTLENSHIDALKMINRLDGVIKYYEDKAKNEQRLENEKKNSSYSISDTTQSNIVFGMN